MPLSRSDLGVTVTETPSVAEAGVSGAWRVQIFNGASQIPPDQIDHLCSNFNQETGVDVRLTAVRNADASGGSVTMFESDYCLLPGDVVDQDMNLDFPTAPGSYTYSFTLSSSDPPEVWGNETWTVEITGEGSGDVGGNDGFNAGTGALLAVLAGGAYLWNRSAKRAESD